MSQSQYSEAAFENVIEGHLIANGYTAVHRDGFDRERAIFPDAVLGFILEPQPKEWAKLEALHGDKTGEQVLSDLCKRIDANGALATLRLGFVCYGRTVHILAAVTGKVLTLPLITKSSNNRV
jgi:type I restriction enzyme R subunit